MLSAYLSACVYFDSENVQLNTEEINIFIKLRVLVYVAYSTPYEWFNNFKV